MWEKVVGAAVGALFMGVLSLIAVVLQSLSSLARALAKKLAGPTPEQALASATPRKSTLPARPSAPKAGVASVADKIYQVEFPDGWTASVLLYFTEGHAKRVLKPTTPELAERMRFTLSLTRVDLPLVPLNGVKVEDVLLDTEVTGMKVIRELMERMKAVQRLSLSGNEIGAAGAASSVADARERPDPAQSSGASENTLLKESTVDAGSGSKVLPLHQEVVPGQDDQKTSPWGSPTLVKKNKPYRGTVLAAGEVPSTFGNGRTSFTVTLRTEEVEKDFRGVELRQEFERQRIQVGDIVEITPLGRKPVPGSDGTRTQNLFEVKLIDRGQAKRLVAA